MVQSKPRGFESVEEKGWWRQVGMGGLTAKVPILASSTGWVLLGNGEKGGCCIMALEGLGDEPEEPDSPRHMALFGVLLPPRGCVVIDVEDSSAEAKNGPQFSAAACMEGTALHHSAPGGCSSLIPSVLCVRRFHVKTHGVVKPISKVWGMMAVYRNFADKQFIKQVNTNTLLTQRNCFMLRFLLYLTILKWAALYMSENPV